MDEVGSWIQPVLMLPGLGLLLLSTTARFGQLEAQLHAVLAREPGPSAAQLQRLRLRARQFRVAIVSLYVGIAALALGSLVGGLVAAAAGPLAAVVTLSMCLAVAATVVAAVALIRESRHSIDVFELESRAAEPDAGRETQPR